MSITLVLIVLLSTILNTVGFVAAKPIYELISKTSFFDAERYFVMSEYCEDMTAKALSGQYHDFFTRDDKIENLTDVLSLGAKSNPCIVGGRGVGKKALVEGLAYRMANGKASKKIENKKIFKINVAKLMVGSNGIKSTPLTRLKAILNKAKSDKNIILFIDDICQIYKITGARELIKTYLDNSDIKIIASATDEEYSGILKKDIFAQDYTYIFLEEPSKFDTFRILKYLKGDIEEKQNIKIFDEVLMDIVNLTGRYMKNKCYPNKAVDILDLAIVNAQKTSGGEPAELERRDVIDAISQVTNMPIGDLSEDEAEALETMNERVKKLVIGQDRAVDLVCSAVKRGRLGLCDENKPRASFLFIGPSGVGKSELARVLGEEIGSFIDIDMLSLGHKHSLDNLIGSKESKSELIEKITKNPYSVVMFDNINSANDAELSVIYEILDRGFLTDFSGRKVDFTNAVIIMTVDLGDKVVNPENKKDVFKKFLEENFSGKLGKSIMKKLTDVVFFNTLSEENYTSIINIKTSELESRLQSFGVDLTISPEVVSYIRTLCRERGNAYGARAVNRFIRENIEMPISHLIIKRELKSGGQVCCNLDGKKVKFDIVRN